MPKKIRPLTEIQFGNLVDERIRAPPKPSVVTELLDKIEPGKAGEFELSFEEHMGLQRHIKLMKKRGKEPLLDAKLISYQGDGNKRVYRMAISRPKT